MAFDELLMTVAKLEGEIERGPIVPSVAPDEIRGYLARYDFGEPLPLDEVVPDVEWMLRSWQVHVTHLNIRARECLVNSDVDARINSFTTHPDSANPSRTSNLRPPAWIQACHRPADALDRVSERTNHLKAWRQGQHPLQTQTTLRGLETHHPTVCRRDPNRAASVRPESEIRRPYCPHTTADWMTRPEPDADSMDCKVCQTTH